MKKPSDILKRHKELFLKEISSSNRYNQALYVEMMALYEKCQITAFFELLDDEHDKPPTSGTQIEEFPNLNDPPW